MKYGKCEDVYFVCTYSKKVCKKDQSVSDFYLLCMIYIRIPLHIDNFYHLVTKGQFISKGLFRILNSLQKRTKKFNFTTMIPQVDLFSFVFWEKVKAPKSPSEIN